MMGKMKQTGIRWIGEIPDKWDTKRIKYMATLKGRIGWQGLTSEEYQDEGAFLITGVDFANGGINWEQCEHVPMKRWEEAKDIQIQNGDLLITKDGTVGKVAIVSDMPGETSLNSGVLRIMPVEGYSCRFLYWVLQSEVFWNWFNFKNAGNSTIVHLYQGDFNEFIYAFPQYDEQERIADYLYKKCSELDSIINDVEKQISVLRRYKQSFITETVKKSKKTKMRATDVPWIGQIPDHWDYKKIGYFANVTKLAGFEFTNYFEYVDEGGVIAIRGLNLKNFEISTEDIQRIPTSISDKLPRSQIHYGDVLISYAGTVGAIGLLKDTTERYHMAPNVGKITVLREVLPEYLAYYLVSDMGQEEINQLKNKNAQESISMENVRRIKVIIPPVDEQEEICRLLDSVCPQIDDLIAQSEQQLRTMESHKKALVYEYVTGKKRVKEIM